MARPGRLLSQLHRHLWLSTSVTYHRQELPQVLFLSQQNYTHVFVMTKHVFCCDKSMLAVTKPLVLTKVFSGCNKTFTCLSWQQFCHDKHTFVRTKHMFFCDKQKTCDKHMFVATNTHLSWQNFCRDFFLKTCGSSCWCQKQIQSWILKGLY